MLNTLVPIFDSVAGRLILGVLNLSSGHPVVTCVLLATLSGAVVLAWMDVVGRRDSAQVDDARPIRLWPR